ncbi:MAG TPA: NADPH-dependent assimilatory sulfite reductase hemoprotein subunit [Ktedonobacterales bacterium]|nr:NADPH-dependent assimilatory sulfite reductase hemoprotein subunit [Ktedonobacterales bacterium]
MSTNPSPNEAIKANSRFLRGTIADGLTRAETGALSDDDQQLTKFHGIYVQDDRDLRAERGRKKMEKAFIFMARMRVPGGVLTPAQWLSAEKIARERGNGTLRLTTRQTIQFHGIIKSNLRFAIQALNDAMLDTIAACGDVNRNVIARVNPWQSRSHAAVYGLADAIATHLLPKSRAWHEIWIDGERLAGAEEEDEPIYGRTYMPRKFKIAVALPPSNDVDVFAHDLGFIAIEEGGAIVGYNVVVGGGMGMTHGEPDTFPRTGDVVGFCLPDQAVNVAEKIATVQRDFGNRSDRKHARLKYTIERIGLAEFRAELERRLGHALAPARAFAFTGNGDLPGWVEGDDGRWHLTLFVENGRVHDSGERRLLSGMHAIAKLGIGRFILTPNQNLVVAEVPSECRGDVDALVREYGLGLSLSGLRRNALACVALPTCGLALAESERYLPSLISRLEVELDQVGLAQDDITIRMTGCPNGCARPYLAEIGLVGRSPGLYNLYIGGAFDGTRMNKLYRKDVDDDAIVAALTPLFRDYAEHRSSGERFSDYAIRARHIRPTVSGRTFHEDVGAG